MKTYNITEKTKEVKKNMSQIRTGFKVCNVQGGRMQSAFDFGRVVKYDISIWTYQPEGCGPLAVFGRLCDVEDFISHNVILKGTSEVFLCEYEESTEKKLYDDEGRSFEFGIPWNTVFATRVKLIKELKRL